MKIIQTINFPKRLDSIFKMRLAKINYIEKFQKLSTQEISTIKIYDQIKK